MINSKKYRRSRNDSKNSQLLKAVVRQSQNRLFSTWQPLWNSRGFSKADCKADSLSFCLWVKLSALNFVQAEGHYGQGSKRGEKSKTDHSCFFLLSATLKVVWIGLWIVNKFSLPLPVCSTPVLFFGSRKDFNHHNTGWWEGQECFLCS